MLSDFLSFLRADETLPALSLAEKGLVYSTPEPGRMEMSDIERSFARLFSSDDGQKVLAHLQVMTFQRALGPACPDEQLRYMEGQRAMVGTILRLIDRGRKQ
jgi:hypothetical protein